VIQHEVEVRGTQCGVRECLLGGGDAHVRRVIVVRRADAFLPDAHFLDDDVFGDAAAFGDRRAGDPLVRDVAAVAGE
jgi:hypothetical protein